MDAKNKKQNKKEEGLELDEKLEDKLAEEELEREEKVGIEKEELETEERVKSLEDQLKRAVADYRNLENRIAEERLEFVKFANKSLLESLLPAFDTLFLASKYSEDQNLQITAKYVTDILKQVGVEKVKTDNVQFDPATMEAIEVVEGEEGKVIEETQPGFTLSGKVLRPARVKVGGKVSS